ncbi:unnamed protein product [Thelazia callipaeda]|uniref:Uncharacterized protein n=1 Tax=Thelazia callipaeda TaxID=103827 RepID=A0A0N5D4Y1_THECL|nr:unnamed protein product [Thelazia callipaeda]
MKSIKNSLNHIHKTTKTKRLQRLSKYNFIGPVKRVRYKPRSFVKSTTFTCQESIATYELPNPPPYIPVFEPNSSSNGPPLQFTSDFISLCMDAFKYVYASKYFKNYASRYLLPMTCDFMNMYYMLESKPVPTNELKYYPAAAQTVLITTPNPVAPAATAANAATSTSAAAVTVDSEDMCVDTDSTLDLSSLKKGLQEINEKINKEDITYKLFCETIIDIQREKFLEYLRHCEDEGSLPGLNINHDFEPLIKWIPQ